MTESELRAMEAGMYEKDGGLRDLIDAQDRAKKAEDFNRELVKLATLLIDTLKRTTDELAKLQQRKES